MKIALSAIKADIDSVGGHICPSHERKTDGTWEHGRKGQPA